MRSPARPASASLAAALLAAASALLCAGCGLFSSPVPLNLSPAPTVRSEVRVAEEVGRLLSPDAEVSAAAERRLLALTDAQRDELVAYAQTLEGERDARWLNVLDEQQALPDLGDEERLDFLLWKAQRPERFFVMKAQNQLLEIARSRPELLIARYEAGGRPPAALALALAFADERAAVPALLARYKNPQDLQDRRAAAEALARLAGETQRPRAVGAPGDLAVDAAIIEAWYREQQESETAPAPEPAEPKPVEEKSGG